MDEQRPHVIILAGPNGAGKTTTAPVLLRDTFAVEEYVNADAIAHGLSAFAPEKAALEAGKIMLRRLRELAEKRRNFAFETTLASRSFAPWIKKLRENGYNAHLLFLSLPDSQFAMDRVAARVRLGGHDIPKGVILRRFDAGLKNLFRLYIPIVTSWKLYDNTLPFSPQDIAEGRGKDIIVANCNRYESLREEYDDGR